jgi:hypothetical protein
MEIKINSHPGGVPETEETSMDSTYYSDGEMIIRTNNSGTPSGCDLFSPLIRGYRKAQPPATISHPSGMKIEKLGNSCVEVVKNAYSR